MATSNTAPDENSSFEDKIAYLRANNIPEDTIAQHFSQSDDPNAQAWSKQYKMVQFENQARKQIDANPVTPALQTSASNAPAPVGNGLVTAATHVADKLGNWYDKLSTPEQIAVPVGAYLGNKAINLGFNTLKDKIAAQIASQTQIDKYAKIQEIKNAANQASQATQAASEISPETPAPVQNNPAPVPETAPAPEVKPTLAELVAAKPSKANPSTVDGGNAPSAEAITPSASTPSTPAEVVTDPTSTPVEKAVELTKEAPKEGVAPPRAARGSLATVANNPAPVEGMPGMRENYTKPKGINPATGEPFIGSGGYNWLHNNLGPERAPIAYEEQYGKINVPYKQVEADYSATRYPPTRETIQAKSGGDFGKPKYIPDYIKGNASIGGMANAGINALGVAGLVSDYKEAKKTGDWSNFGQNATGQAIANILPKAAFGTQLATFSKELGESPEELKALGKKLQEAQQASKIGAGRGMQGVPPPNR